MRYIVRVDGAQGRGSDTRLLVWERYAELRPRLENARNAHTSETISSLVGPVLSAEGFCLCEVEEGLTFNVGG